jgi:aminopeptidase N
MWLSHNISIKWWDDSFFFEAINLFLASLFIEEVQSMEKFKNVDFPLLFNLFDFFKSKAITADKSMDCHQVILDIDDTEEAEILIDDEITLFKTASLIKYLYSIDKSNFVSILKKYFQTYSSGLSSKLAGYRDFIEIYENFENNTEKNIFAPIQQFKYYLVNERVPRLFSVRRKI